MGLYETKSTTGETIDAIIRFNLDLKNLRRQTYDGAGNMSGKYNGAKRILPEKQPLAYYTHCVAHRVNLVT